MTTDTTARVSGTIKAVADSLDQWAEVLQAGRELRPSIMGLRDMAKAVRLAAIQPDSEPVAVWMLTAQLADQQRQDLAVALNDAINSPKGVVPASAEQFYDGKAGRVLPITPSSAGMVSVEAAARVLLDSLEAEGPRADEDKRWHDAWDAMGKAEGYGWNLMSAALRALAGERG